MVNVISDDLVESTWQEVGSFDENKARKMMMKLGDRQTDLLTFVTTSMEDLQKDAIELGVYVFYVVYRIFEKSCKTKIKRISANKIISAYEKNESMLLRLEGAHDRFFERVSEVETSKQPYVIKYVLDAIMEADKGPDPVFLSEESIGSIFLILKTVVDVLDRALTISNRR